ncbi:hypothetical protein [Caulobacter sp. NIBR1757]|uniref:hypothetical protein n=1 Tax=Caulobacter sp. NIBR1757 TaxID=3016000 RepID=UPI0022F022CE|nr:hypothetical protein [Caulobacter sp. NIBR1757]WGM37225.1 hypothetical protein AMEJIAPC_00119 [Caulobacter sp. NIBR1757]
MDAPFDLVFGGVILAQVVMIGLCLLVYRWRLATFRFEREVMTIAMLVTGPLGMLLMDAIPLDPPYMAALKTYLQLGVVILLVQVLFWSAFLRLRARHIAEQAVLKAAGA